MDLSKVYPFIDIIPLCIFPQKIIVVFSMDDEDIEMFMSENKYEKDDYSDILQRPDHEAGVTLQLNNGNVIVRINKLDYSGDDIKECIDHESVHIAFFILDHIKIPLVIGNSDEVYCYTIEYIIKEITKKFSQNFLAYSKK